MWVSLLVTITHGQLATNPCFGRPDGFARDLTSCRHFFACRSGSAQRGLCDNGNFFDGETEDCVRPHEARCFQCPGGSNSYELFSVPRACPQYIRCFNGQVSLHICPSGLSFDGRRGIRNCNYSPGPGICYRENDGGDGGASQQRCPFVGNQPVYLPDRRSCSV